MMAGCLGLRHAGVMTDMPDAVRLEEVARRMGVARPRVAELESRPLSVSFGRLLAYADALGIPLRGLPSRSGRDLGPSGARFQTTRPYGRVRAANATASCLQRRIYAGDAQEMKTRRVQSVEIVKFALT